MVATLHDSILNYDESTLDGGAVPGRVNNDFDHGQAL